MVTRVKVKGESMFPSIRNESEIRVEFSAERPPALSVGDVVCYLLGERCLVHRVVGKRGEEWIVAGDGGVVPHKIPREAVVGRVEMPWWNAGWRGRIIHRFSRIAGGWGKWRSLFDPSRRIPSIGACDEMVLSQYNDPEEVGWYRRDVSEGLNPKEKAIVNRYLPDPRRILNVGCGSGREAFELAGMGHQIVAIDRSKAMIESARRLAESKASPVLFEQAEAEAFTADPASFDAVYFSLGSPSYGLVAGRKRRVELMKRFRTFLKPGGLLMFSVIYDDSARWWSPANVARIVRSAIGWWKGEGYHGERGDTAFKYGSLGQGIGYHHVFSSVGDVLREVKEAGYLPLLSDDGGTWVCRLKG